MQRVILSVLMELEKWPFWVPLRIMMLLYLYFILPHATQEDIRLCFTGYLWLEQISLTVTVTEHDYNCVCHLKIIS